MEDQLRLENLKFMYRVVNEICAKPLVNFYVNTRQQNRSELIGGNVAVNQHRLTIVNKSFLCKPVMDWNALAADSKNASSLHNFSKKLKRLYLQKY